MYDDAELKRLRERIAGLSNQDLVKMVEVDHEDYRPEALEYAMAELNTRRVAYMPPPPQTEEVIYEEDEEAEDALPEPIMCVLCGAAMRLGYLFTEREVTIVFADNNEQHFVEVHTCPKCGNLRIIIDYETEVEE